MRCVVSVPLICLGLVCAQAAWAEEEIPLVWTLAEDALIPNDWLLGSRDQAISPVSPSLDLVLPKGLRLDPGGPVSLAPPEGSASLDLEFSIVMEGRRIRMEFIESPPMVLQEFEDLYGIAESYRPRYREFLLDSFGYQGVDLYQVFYRDGDITTLIDFFKEQGYILPGDFAVKHIIGENDIRSVQTLLDPPSKDMIILRPPDLSEDVAKARRQRAAAATGVLVLVDPEVHTIFRQDGQLSFPQLMTYGAEAASRGRFCDAKTGAELLLGRCTGVLAQDDQGNRLWVTAKHCLEDFQGDMQAYLVFDFDDLDSGYDSAGSTFTSDLWIEISPAQLRLHPLADIAYVTVPAAVQGLPEPVELANDAVLAINDPVYSVGHPQGRPKKGIAGLEVRIASFSDTLFTAWIDNFKVSSGSPVFDLRSRLLGILVQQEKPFDFTTLHPDQSAPGCVGEKISNESDTAPPLILRTVLIDEIPVPG